MYDWKITYLEVCHKDKKLKKLFKKHHIPPRYVMHVKNNYIGGVHFCSTDKRESLILIYNNSNKKQRVNTISHEIRHLEDSILACWKVQDKESNAILSGYIEEKFYSAKLFKLC